MSSNIDITKPVQGPTATTESIRNNFSITKTEIEALQTGKQDSNSVLTGTTASFTTDQQTKLSNLPDNFNSSVDSRINTQKGNSNGLCPLGPDSKVSSTYLPSYVDDVLEYANLASFPATGESGKIYVALDTNKTYRWSGSAYFEISASPGSTDAVPEGSSNLYFTNARVFTQLDTYYAEAFDGATQNAKWQAAIDYASANGGGIVTTKEKNITLTGIKVKESNVILDFNGATIFANLSNADIPQGQSCIQLEGVLSPTQHVINSVSEGNHFVVLSNASDISNYSVGDYIIVSNSTQNPVWNNGKQAETSAFYSVYYGSWWGGKEIHRITDIDSVNNRLHLDFPADYNHSTAPRVQKIVKPLINVAVRNIHNIYQTDPGASYTGLVENLNAPHLVAAYYCVKPVLENIRSTGWQLTIAKMSNCYGGVWNNIVGMNPFRPLSGGHGYVTRGDYCFDIKASHCSGIKTRHVLDYVQCRDINTNNNSSYNSANTPYLLHGANSRRWTSVDDASFANPKDYLQGFTVGNPAFAGDSEVKLIRPKVRGGSHGIFIFNSKNITIIDPDIDEVAAHAICALQGSSGIKIKGGRLAIAPKSIPWTDSQQIIRIGMHNIFDETSTFGLECSNVEISDVELDIRNVEYSTNAYRQIAGVFIDAQGDIRVSNCKVVNADPADTNIGTQFRGVMLNYRAPNQSAQGNPAPANVFIENNKFLTTCSRGINQLAAPTGLNVFRWNVSTGDTNSLARVILTNRSVIEGNISLLPVFFASNNTAIATALAAGTLIRDNNPPTLWDGRVRLNINGGGTDANSRTLAWNTVVNGSYNLLARFVARLTVGAETGSNAGSNLEFIARDDAGNPLSVPLTLERSTGSVIVLGTWQSPFRLGLYCLWVEAATGRLRIKSSAPVSDTDGTVVGSQS